MELRPERTLSRLYGYRSWQVVRGQLFSSGGFTRSTRAWEAGEYLRAICWRNLFLIANHQAPGERCSCGIYAWRGVPELRDGPAGLDLVWGVVALAGKVIVHAKGYRAQLARPAAIEVSDVIDVEPIAKRYGLVVLDSLRNWV